jgi:hypothetical protein
MAIDLDLGGRIGEQIYFDPATPTLADVAPRDLFVVGRRATLDLSEVALNVKIDRNIEVSSAVTITCADPDREILTSRALWGIGPDKQPDPTRLDGLLVLDNLVFQLALLSRQAAGKTQLTFESETIARLRKFKGPLTQARGTTTRAQFMKHLCDEAGVDFFCPEINEVQPIAKTTDALTPAKRRRSRAPGISKLVANGVRIKGDPTGLSEEQRTNLNAALDVARSVGASRTVVLAMIVAGIQESSWTYAVNEIGAEGVFQLIPSTQQATGLDPRDVTACAHWFLTKGFGSEGAAMKIAAENPTWTPGKVALYTEGGQERYSASSYDRWLQEAQAIMSAYTGGSPELRDTVEVTAPVQLRRKKNENSWQCLKRLNQEGPKGWWLFENAGTIYYISAKRLRRSEPRMLVAPGAAGIDEVTFDIATSPRFDDAISVTCQLGAWQAPPGSAVDVSGYGAVDGRWLVQSISRGKLSSTTSRVTLCPPIPKGVEPAGGTKQLKAGPSSIGLPDTKYGGEQALTGGVRERVVEAAKKAAKLSKQNPNRYHYLAGGVWKDDLYAPDKPGDRSDCSSFVIQVYAKVLGYSALPPALQHQGNTDSLAAVGRKTDSPQPGDICLYGGSGVPTLGGVIPTRPGPFDHVELYIGERNTPTIGHGDQYINAGLVSGPGAHPNFAGYWTFDFLDDDFVLHARKTAAARHPRT